MSKNRDEIISILSADPVLRPLLGRLEFPEPLADRDPYFDLIRSIVFQQLSVKAAHTIFERFLSLFEDRWPHPDVLLQLETETLRSAGLSRQKAGYIQNIAAFFQAENLIDGHWRDWEDEAILQLFTRIKGVGRWTAEMVLMFTLNRPDVFPVDDLGIQTAMQRLYGIDRTRKDWKIEMTSSAEAWRPYRTYASKYLWKYLDAEWAK